MRRALAVLAFPLVAGLVATAALPGWQPYRVRSGDTLWALARRHGTTVREIQRANGLPGDLIRVGDLLSLPGTGTAAARTGSGPGPAVARRTRTFRVDPAVARHRTQLAHGRHPSRARVRALIRAEAAHRGVDPALVLAVADMESGFDQRSVSHTDAVGVMQLMPQTAADLSHALGRPLDRMHAADNVAGGVVLLRSLLSAADERTAIAGYYQGLGSVRRRGMLPDTRRYVRTVVALRARFRERVRP